MATPIPTGDAGQHAPQSSGTPPSQPAARTVRARRDGNRNWDRRVEAVAALARTPGFQRLRDDLIGLAELTAADRVIDVGAGSGLLTLAAAPQVAHVTAVDISVKMCAALEGIVAAAEITNVTVKVASATALPLADASVDVVLSNYCLHHLSDGDKRVALGEVARVLVPGGRFVLGDMMFHVGVRAKRDRTVILRFAMAQLRRGPAGILRLLRNAGRLLAGTSEHPASVDWWEHALRAAGFDDVRAWALGHEGGIAVSRRGTTA